MVRLSPGAGYCSMSMKVLTKIENRGGVCAHECAFVMQCTDYHLKRQKKRKSDACEICGRALMELYISNRLP